MTIADLPDEELRLDHPLLLRASKYSDESAEWALGMGMTIMVFLEYSLQSVDVTDVLQTVACALCIATFVVQGMLLTRNMKVLVDGNVAQHLLVERLVKQAKAARRLTVANTSMLAMRATTKGHSNADMSGPGHRTKLQPRRSMASTVSFAPPNEALDFLASPVADVVVRPGPPAAVDSTGSPASAGSPAQSVPFSS